MITRRGLLKGVGALATTTFGVGAYAFGITPGWLKVTRYAVSPTGWPVGFGLKIAVLADLHACDPWMGLDQIANIVDETNAQRPDAIVLLGDYVAGHRMLHRSIPAATWAGALSRLQAPLGVHAVLGNHDWWEDWPAQERGRGPVQAQNALMAVGIPVYENNAVRLLKGKHAFWIAGLGDQWAFYYRRDPKEPPDEFNFLGVDDLPATLGKITDQAPVILLAHEPDIFACVPPRVALTLCGHTHGGQVSLFGYSPSVPSRFGRRYRYGHIVDEGRHMIVSGGLGCSGMPIRFGVPPEIVIVDIEA